MYNLEFHRPKNVTLPKIKIQSTALLASEDKCGRDASVVTVVRGRKPVSRLAKGLPDVKSVRCPKAARRRLWTPPRQSDAHVVMFREWEVEERQRIAVQALLQAQPEPAPAPPAESESEIEFKKVLIKDIIINVCEVFGYGKADLLSARRYKELARARQAAMYLAVKLTVRSLPEIGRKLGGRHHSTVLYAERKIRKLISEGDAVLALKIATVEARL